MEGLEAAGGEPAEVRGPPGLEPGLRQPPSQQGELSRVPRTDGWGSAVCQAWCQAPLGHPSGNSK